MEKNQERQQEKRYSSTQRKSTRKRRALGIRYMIYSILAIVLCISFVKIATGLLFTYGNSRHNTNSTNQQDYIDKNGTKSGTKGFIVIDPGHGGKDSPGCTYGGLLERDITLELALQLKNKLTTAGYKVLLTRETNMSVELEERTKIANESGADLFISLHLNAHDDIGVSGIETWYNPNSNSNNNTLAQTIEDSITESTKAKNRGTYSNSTLVVIRDTLIPSCLVEVGYLSNDSERLKMTTEEYRDQISQGILNGLELYFKQFQPSTITDNNPSKGDNTTKDNNTSKGFDNNDNDDSEGSDHNNDENTKGNHNGVNKPDKPYQPVKNVSNGKKDKVVYLTFDDGPSSNTEKILKILDQHKIKGTFFVTGINKQYFPMIKKAYQKGHTIGLHTYSHDYSKVYSSENAFFEDLDSIGSLVKQEIGFVPHFIRFPGGSSNGVSKQYNPGIMSRLVNQVLDNGYQYYDWDISSEDAAHNTTVESIVKGATACHWSKITILLHDATGKQNTVKALSKIIEIYKQRGYRFEKITDNTIPIHHKTLN